MPVTSDGQYVSRNAHNPNKSTAFQMEHTIAGRNPQPSFVIESEGLRNAHEPTVRDFGCGSTDVELCSIRRAVFAQRASAAVNSHMAIGPAIQSIWRADPNASIRGSLYRMS